MTILANDIKLVASRVMDDVPEGGGAPTAIVVADGASNAIFPDISELDRAGGDVSFRKVFIHVQTDNTDTYLGSNVIVAEPPSDPNVTVTLFSTGETFDERLSASARVESYLVAGPEWAGYLFENHISGQRAIQLFQRTTEAPPNIGETIILVYNEGLPGERRQYVRVIATSVIIRTFTRTNGDSYQAAVVTCDLSDPLRYDFPGSPPSEYFTRGTNPASTKVRESSVGDAAIYAGVSPVTQPIAIGDIAARVKSVFTQLVPSAQTEIPLVDQNAAGQYFAMAEASNGSVSFTTSQPFNSTTSMSLSNPVLPGSLTIAIGSSTLTDVGGQVFDGATVVGTIDYGRGIIAFPTLASGYSGTKTITFKIAAAPLRVGDTAQIPVTQESRSFNYVLTILPTPAAGSLLVSYRAQGRWYDLRDNGGGALRGTDATFGVGAVNYSTGAVSVTLGALPDDGSSILFTWASKVNYINRSGMPVEAPSVRTQLGTGNIAPDSITIAWNDGVARTAADDGKGKITGDATGTIDYQTGELKITPTNLPAGGQEYDVGYGVGSDTSLITSSVDIPTRNVDGSIDVNLGRTDIAPGTVKLSWTISLVESVVQNTAGSGYTVWSPPYTERTVHDDGAGKLIDIANNGQVGTVNYATGAAHITLDGAVVAQGTEYRYIPGPAAYTLV